MGLAPRVWSDIFWICMRSVASLSNGIIFIVLGLLFYFGQAQTVIFLSLAIVGGVFIGVINDIRARLALEKLQMLTTPMYMRVLPNGHHERVLAEALQVNDRIKLILGDQVPCDAQLAEADNLEISQALLTGESDSYPRREGDPVHAGDIVVAGSGIAIIRTSFNESELSKMTSAIKRYSINQSPIQQSVQTVVTYSGYGILALLVFVGLRGYVVHESLVDIVQNAAALTSTLVPQGLLVAVTILFSYGAIRLYREQVLLQDINATEKLGRIKNLCIDKTGTLTENTPSVLHMHVFEDGTENETLELAATYLKGSGDSSQTAKAIERFAHRQPVGEVWASTPFTSQRQFGAVALHKNGQSFALVMGGPDILLPHVPEGQGHGWLKEVMVSNKKGTRLVCLARTDVRAVPTHLNGVSLHPIAVFELMSSLRPGTRGIISFFQARGVRVRVISGDNPETVRTIAQEAGITHAHEVITGEEIEKWSSEEYASKLDRYAVFARIRPELKEKLIERFRSQGFTAMIGDGANDALAIKKSDLGVAMFEGASATRGLAAVVLMDNSFAALPKGIAMADTIIGNIEIIASLYFFEMVFGAVLFAGAVLLGQSYPFSPQNMILINYCMVGLPGIVTFFWAMRGRGHTRQSSKSFLHKIVPFAAKSALISAVLTIVVLALPYLPVPGMTHTSPMLAFIMMGLIFFCAAPFVYTEGAHRAQAFDLLVYGGAVFALLFCAYMLPVGRLFFAITTPSLLDICVVITVALSFVVYICFMLKRCGVDKILT